MADAPGESIFCSLNRYRIEHFWPQIADAYALPEDEFVERLYHIVDIVAEATGRDDSAFRSRRSMQRQEMRWAQGKE